MRNLFLCTQCYIRIISFSYIHEFVVWEITGSDIGKPLRVQSGPIIADWGANDTESWDCSQNTASALSAEFHHGCCCWDKITLDWMRIFFCTQCHICIVSFSYIHEFEFEKYRKASQGTSLEVSPLSWTSFPLRKTLHELHSGFGEQALFGQNKDGWLKLTKNAQQVPPAERAEGHKNPILCWKSYKSIQLVAKSFHDTARWHINHNYCTNRVANLLKMTRFIGSR